jgi:hypothetical protein
MEEYRLINPLVQGEFQTNIKAASSNEAAQKYWNELSRYFTNNIDNFAFTLQRGGRGGKCSHYRVKEKVMGNNVEFTISKLKNGIKKEHEQQLIELYNSQHGGKKHKKSKHRSRDSSSSSSDSSNVKHIYHHNNINPYPIVTWDYAPFVYNFDIPYFSVPTWVSPFSPQMKILPLGVPNWSGLHVVTTL